MGHYSEGYDGAVRRQAPAINELTSLHYGKGYDPKHARLYIILAKLSRYAIMSEAKGNKYRAMSKAPRSSYRGLFLYPDNSCASAQEWLLLHHIRSLLKSYEAKNIVSPGKAIDYQTKNHRHKALPIERPLCRWFD